MAMCSAKVDNCSAKPTENYYAKSLSPMKHFSLFEFTCLCFATLLLWFNLRALQHYL